MRIIPAIFVVCAAVGNAVAHRWDARFFGFSRLRAGQLMPGEGNNIRLRPGESHANDHETIPACTRGVSIQVIQVIIIRERGVSVRRFTQSGGGHFFLRFSL